MTSRTDNTVKNIYRVHRYNIDITITYFAYN